MSSPVKKIDEKSSFQTKNDEQSATNSESYRTLTAVNKNKRKRNDSVDASSNKTRIHNIKQQEAASLSFHETFQANDLVTLVRTDLEQRSPTLVLKLKPTDLKWFQPRRWFSFCKLSSQEIDEYIGEQFDEYIKVNRESLNNIRQRIKQSRPQEGTNDYENKLKQYLKLVHWSTKLIESLTKMFEQMLTFYRQRVEKLWDEINQFRLFSSSNMNVLEENFLKGIDEYFQQAMTEHVEPILSEMENEIKIEKRNE
ncbi:hypothetical protein I4U23_004599 [Adineta vaga]|nr:hypothetical protein I4U23_004599 [Adineta vaga]